MAKFPMLIALLVLALPAGLYAVGMGGMGGVAGMVDKITIQTEDVGVVEFSHSVHGTRCNECHPKLFQKKRNSNHVTMQAMERGRSCGACHNGRRAFSVKGDCTTCHAGDILYTVEDAGNVIFPHAAHIDMFGCDDCHPDLFRAEQGTNQASMAEMEEGAVLRRLSRRQLRLRRRRGLRSLSRDVSRAQPG